MVHFKVKNGNFASSKLPAKSARLQEQNCAGPPCLLSLNPSLMITGYQGCHLASPYCTQASNLQQMAALIRKLACQTSLLTLNSRGSIYSCSKRRLVGRLTAGPGAAAAEVEPMLDTVTWPLMKVVPSCVPVCACSSSQASRQSDTGVVWYTRATCHTADLRHAERYC